MWTALGGKVRCGLAGQFTHLTLRYAYDGKEIIDRRRIRKYDANYTY